MPPVVAKRMTAAIDGEVVVFLIGMRINHLWKVHKWWPVASAMPRMIRELLAHPELCARCVGNLAEPGETRRFA